MAREIEAKIKVDTLEAVRARLQECGARSLYRVLETNQLFDTPDQKLFQSGCGLRIRTCRGEGDVPSATLTFKGPQQPGPLKSRDELETAVADAESTRAILEGLGYVRVILFEKRREEWELGRLKVALDELPRLGCYVEIEGPDEGSVREFQHQLGLDDRPSIRDNYIALLINHARNNGLAWDEVPFC